MFLVEPFKKCNPKQLTSRDEGVNRRAGESVKRCLKVQTNRLKVIMRNCVTDATTSYSITRPRGQR